MRAGTINGPVTMGEIYGDVHHPMLRHGRWWACNHPERPFEDILTQIMFTCAKCFPLWEVAYLDGVQFFDHANGGYHTPPQSHGDRFHWFMDVVRWAPHEDG